MSTGRLDAVCCSVASGCCGYDGPSSHAIGFGLVNNQVARIGQQITSVGLWLPLYQKARLHKLVAYTVDCMGFVMGCGGYSTLQEPFE